jgi:ubiquinone/menaquinone biosynthesis C-methylase UbiE
MRTLVGSTRYYAKKTARLGREAGAVGLLALTCRKLASPFAAWGAITFFERRLDGAPASAVGASPGFQALQMTASEVGLLREGGDPTQDVAALAERFERGDRAFGAVDANGRVCHVRWVATTRAHIPEIGRDVVLAPRQAYFYNGYTRPDARRCGLDGLVRNFIFATLQSEGYGSVYSYVRRHNRAGLRAASRWQQAIGTVRYIQIGRSTPWLSGIPEANIPRLEEPKTPSRLQRTREDAWKQWFNSWLGEPLSKRSTGCAALTDESFQSATDFIDTALRIDPDRDVVLDVGCDSAMISRLIAPHTRRFGGVDFITAMLKDAASLHVATADGHPAWFAAADACHLPFRSQTFTKVYCSAMIHTLPTREHGLRAIDELIRVTAATGVVLLSSVPDRAKRMAARFDLWKRAGWLERISLPVRWVVPASIKQLARRALRRPSTGLPEFLHYDLRALQRSLEARGFRCEMWDFPPNYWNSEFRTSRSNLLIYIPERTVVD